MASLFKHADFLYDVEKADDDVDRLPPNSQNPHSSMLPLQCRRPWRTQKFAPENIFHFFQNLTMLWKWIAWSAQTTDLKHISQHLSLVHPTINSLLLLLHGFLQPCLREGYIWSQICTRYDDICRPRYDDIYRPRSKISTSPSCQLLSPQSTRLSDCSDEENLSIFSSFSTF